MKINYPRPFNYMTRYAFWAKIFSKEEHWKTADILESWTPKWPFELYNAVGEYLQDKRTKIVIEDHDIWSVDYISAKIMLPMIIKLKGDKQGIPAEFVCELDGMFNDIENNRQLEMFPVDEWHGESQRRYDAVLDEIIFAMSAIIEENDAPVYSEPYWTKTDDGRRFELDKLKFEEYESRASNGLILLGKHFRSLWV